MHESTKITLQLQHDVGHLGGGRVLALEYIEANSRHTAHRAFCIHHAKLIHVLSNLNVRMSNKD